MLEGAGVHVLVVIRRAGKGDKDRWFSGRCDLAHRARPRPAYKQVRLGKHPGHVVNELEHLGGVPRLLISGADPIVIEKKAARTGTPVTRQFGKYRQVCWKCTAAADTQRATTRLANPGTTLGSNAIVRTPRRIAAAIAGPEA